MLTVELKIEDPKKLDTAEIEIYCDSSGLDFLIAKLQQLKESKSNVDHTHLMTPAWSGNELTEVKAGSQKNILINHLVVTAKK